MIRKRCQGCGERVSVLRWRCRHCGTATHGGERGPMLLGAALVLAGAIGGLSLTPAVAPREAVVIVTPAAPVYARPDTDADVVGRLHAGERVLVEPGAERRWGQILSDPFEGDYVRVARAPTTD